MNEIIKSFNEFMHQHEFNNIDEVYRGLRSTNPSIKFNAFQVYQLKMSLGLQLTNRSMGEIIQHLTSYLNVWLIIFFVEKSTLRFLKEWIL